MSASNEAEWVNIKLHLPSIVVCLNWLMLIFVCVVLLRLDGILNEVQAALLEVKQITKKGNTENSRAACPEECPDAGSS